jgi:isoleucyl-tRNA synthetase
VELDLQVTPELTREGLAREVIRAVQDARRAADLAVGDRIEVGLGAAGALADAIAAHRDAIASEVLAAAVLDGPLAGVSTPTVVDVDGSALSVSLRRV